MILSKNILPSVMDGTEELYYRIEGDVSFDFDRVCLKEGSVLSLDTFFNMFPLAQYREYTVVQDITVRTSVEGSVTTEIVGVKGGSEDVLCSSEDGYVEYTVISDRTYDWIFVRFVSKGESCVLSLPEYVSDCVPKGLRITGVICTYRREDFVRRNMSNITHYLEERDVPGEFSLFVVDNGNTLSDDEIEYSDRARLFHNPNTGGSGGFARGMIESMESGFTHSILMDDDIYVEPEILARTVVLMNVLKEEYSRSNIVGQLLDSENPMIMEERVFDGEIMTSRFSHTDMSSVESLKRDVLDWGRCRGWWFCSLTLDEDCLPLPLFFQYDDLDYFLRNAENGVIGFTGVGIWHHSVVTALESKSKIMYYGERNRMIVEAVHKKRFTERLPHYLNRAARALSDKDYNSLKLLNTAMKDYLSGPEHIEGICNSDYDKIVRSMNDSNPIRFGPVCKKDILVMIRNSLSKNGAIGLIDFIYTTASYMIKHKKVDKAYHTKYRKMRSTPYWKKTLRDEDGRL